MASRLIPKQLTEDHWQPLVQRRDYAILCNENESVFFRFGLGHGLVLSIDPTPSGRVINAVDFETGEGSLLGKMASEIKNILGRTTDCSIKVMHAIISRQHLEITLKGNVLVVRDLGSTNGTFLLKQIKHFDIATYLEQHPLGAAQESTLDWVHEDFGPGIDEFLKAYSH